MKTQSSSSPGWAESRPGEESRPLESINEMESGERLSSNTSGGNPPSTGTGQGLFSLGLEKLPTFPEDPGPPEMAPGGTSVPEVS